MSLHEQRENNFKYYSREKKHTVCVKCLRYSESDRLSQHIKRSHGKHASAVELKTMKDEAHDFAIDRDKLMSKNQIVKLDELSAIARGSRECLYDLVHCFARKGFIVVSETEPPFPPHEMPQSYKSGSSKSSMRDFPASRLWPTGRGEDIDPNSDSETDVSSSRSGEDSSLQLASDVSESAPKVSAESVPDASDFDVNLIEQPITTRGLHDSIRMQLFKLHPVSLDGPVPFSKDISPSIVPLEFKGSGKGTYLRCVRDCWRNSQKKLREADLADLVKPLSIDRRESAILEAIDDRGYGRSVSVKKILAMCSIPPSGK